MRGAPHGSETPAWAWMSACEIFFLTTILWCFIILEARFRMAARLEKGYGCRDSDAEGGHGQCRFLITDCRLKRGATAGAGTCSEEWASGTRGAGLAEGTTQCGRFVKTGAPCQNGPTSGAEKGGLRMREADSRDSGLGVRDSRRKTGLNRRRWARKNEKMAQSNLTSLLELLT